MSVGVIYKAKNLITFIYIYVMYTITNNLTQEYSL